MENKQQENGQAQSPWAELTDFKMFTDSLSARKDADGIVDTKRPQIYGIGSSELEDMAGDRMLMSAMQDMTRFSVRSAIWMNHRYDVPEDVFGAIKIPPEIRIEQPNGLGLTRATKPYYAVGITVDVARRNPRALDSFGLISEDDIRLGLSIGCEITGYDIRKDEDGLPFGLDIEHLRTLEWSVVGIPCNEESWIQNWAEKGFTGLVRRKGSLPTIKSGSDLLYAAKNFGDFDELTGLYMRRVHESTKLAVIVDNFDEIREKHGDQVANFFKIMSEPLQKHGYFIARYPTKR